MTPTKEQALRIKKVLMEVMMETWGAIPSDEEMATKGSMAFDLPDEGVGQMIYSWDEQPFVTFTYLTQEGSIALAIQKHK